MTQVGNIARLRQGLYRFFGGALSHPGDEEFATLRAAGDVLQTFPIADFAYFGAWRRFQRALAGIPTATSLDAEYVRLFASGTDGALCPPIESFYVAKAEGGGIADTVATLQRTYHELGLRWLDAEAPDHIATELNVLSTLCGREADGWAADDARAAVRDLRRQNLFLRLHVLAWFTQFADRVRSASPDGFYALVVDAVDAFLTHDYDWTRALIERVEVEA
ncbi:MAG TPA: molecular chaperone TorD family protein [Acidimicrobiia bacterium]|jgi:TorA maturation chaperone TorD|nr:molecular chaperone TorD family protein [Acidimicrobiia bacterium]